jgi:hypothetical protein
VTYTFSSTDSEDATWTIYSDGANSRVDFISEDGTFIVITTADASYTCSESGGEGFCFPGESGGTNPFAGLFTQYGSGEAILAYADAFAGIDLETSSEEIAGVDASCFAASGDFDGDSGSLKWCFSDSGLLLLSSYELSSGTVEMRATEASDDVPDGIFDPPYDVTELGQ